MCPAPDHHDLTGVLGPELPLALHDVHTALPVGTVTQLLLPPLAPAADGRARGRATPVDRADDPAEPVSARDLVVGAGFTVEAARRVSGATAVTARRARSLADTVGPDLRLLVCGLNPSEYAADAGVGFARPGNRFWPAALAAGAVTRDRDARHALDVDGVGLTDLVKRATRRAEALAAEEYAHGLDRVNRLVAWLQPQAVVLVGLAGWRCVVDARAPAGWQHRRLGGRPTYLMPSTSGANAHASTATLTAHLVEALSGAPDRMPGDPPLNYEPPASRT